jgi:hypothetical protein
MPATWSQVSKMHGKADVAVGGVLTQRTTVKGAPELEDAVDVNEVSVDWISSPRMEWGCVVRWLCLRRLPIAMHDT